MLEQEIQAKKGVLEPILEKDKTQDISYYENIIKEVAPKSIKDVFEVEEETLEIKLNVTHLFQKTISAVMRIKLIFIRDSITLQTDEEQILL